MSPPPRGRRESYFEEGYLRRWSLPPAGPLEVERAAAYLRLGATPPGARVLDVGCGHGRYAIAVARLGHRVCGLDASRALVRRARADARPDQPVVWWVRADMRALPFGSEFDIALILDSFGYFDADGEDVSFLRDLRVVLRGAGRLVMRNPNGALIRDHFRPSDEEVRPDSITRLRNELHGNGRWLHQDVTIEQPGSIRTYERRQRIYTARELEEILRESGFSVVGHYADASGEVFVPGTSTHVVTASVKA